MFHAIQGGGKTTCPTIVSYSAIGLPEDSLALCRTTLLALRSQLFTRSCFADSGLKQLCVGQRPKPCLSAGWLALQAAMPTNCSDRLYCSTAHCHCHTSYPEP